MNSNRKGKVGERELASKFKEEGWDARRGQQYQGGEESPDVVVGDLPWLHVECKRTKRQFRLWDAMAQAKADASEGQIPAVFHRRNRSPWVVVLTFEDFAKMAREYTGSQTERGAES